MLPISLPSASAAESDVFMFLQSCVSAEIFAFLMRPENVGISTAARIAITAMTITSSTMVNPFLLFFIFLLLSFFGAPLAERSEEINSSAP